MTRIDDVLNRLRAEFLDIARTNRCQLLVIGTSDAVEQSLALLMPHVEPPVCWWSPDAALPPPRDVNTLVIRHIELLTLERQRDLRLWLERAAEPRPRVVSTTTVPLFPRVAAGLFLDALYYSLNTVTLGGADAVPISPAGRREPRSALGQPGRETGADNQLS